IGRRPACRAFDRRRIRRRAKGALLAQPCPGCRLLEAGRGGPDRRAAAVSSVWASHGPRRPPVPGFQWRAPNLLSLRKPSGFWPSFPTFRCSASCTALRTTRSSPASSHIRPVSPPPPPPPAAPPPPPAGLPAFNNPPGGESPLGDWGGKSLYRREVA